MDKKAVATTQQTITMLKNQGEAATAAILQKKLDVMIEMVDVCIHCGWDNRDGRIGWDCNYCGGN